MLLAVTGWGKAAAETVSPYVMDFNTEFSTADHYFTVAYNWKHIVPNSDYDGYGPYYMSYTYSTSGGVDGSGALLAYKQYAGDNYGGEVVKDILVTPVVNGEVKMYVKSGGLPNSTYPTFVEFYETNSSGTQIGDVIKRYTVENFKESDVEGWDTVTISVNTAKRIGIRLQNVYADNFSATSAELEKEKKLTIASAVPSATTGTIYWDQQANTNVLVKYTVTVKNTGEAPLEVGDENYSISIFNRKSKEVYTTVDIPQDLAVGETSNEFDVAVELPTSTWPNSYTYINMDLQENISGSVVQRAQSQYHAYEPKFVFREEGSTSTSSFYADIAFGKVTEETSKSYEIYNDGIAPLQIKSITVPEGFLVDNEGNFTLNSKASQSITITLPVTTTGIFSGNVEIVYVDKNGADVVYTKAITGTVLDPSKNMITFDDGAGNSDYPAGSVRFNVYISSEGSGVSKNYYLQSSTPNPLYITPLMTATDGESLTFDAEAVGNSSSKVEVMISTDRQNWTTIQTISSIASRYDWTTYSASIPEAGDYYIGFKLTSAMIDNIYGLVYATAPEHDLLLVASNIPTNGKQNQDYTVTASIGNVGPNVETAGTYSATLYVDGEAVATSNDVDLPVADISGNYNNGDEQNYTKLTFTFKPHVVGEKAVYIEVKSGDAVLITDEVIVNFAEEKLENDVAVGEANGTSTYVPFHSPWMDDSNGSMSDFYYTKDQLKAFGIDEGKVITAISFRGTPSSNKTINSLTAEAWVGMQEAGTFVVGNPDKDNMTHVTIYSEQAFDFSTSEVVEFTIDLSAAPIVYDGESDIRFYTNIDGHGQWLNINFEVDKNYPGQSFYAHGANPSSWSSTNSPVGHFALAVEAKMLTGIVTEEDGTTPVAGATVTIRNNENDIEYFATTDETGAYSINVVQNNLTYTTTVTASGYETLEDTEELNFTEQSHTKNFVLTKMPSVDIAISQYGYSTFYYSNSAYIIPEGVTAYIVSGVEGKSISLVPLDGVIPAGCGVLLEGAEGSYTFEATSDEVPGEDNMLRGTDETEMIEEDPEQECKYYMLSVKNDVAGFYFGVDGGGVFENKAHKAYLAVPVKLSNGVNFYGFDNATGINYVRTYSQKADGAIYNLSGQRVNNSYKGVVIVNGKKVLKK